MFQMICKPVLWMFKKTQMIVFVRQLRIMAQFKMNFDQPKAKWSLLSYKKQLNSVASEHSARVDFATVSGICPVSGPNLCAGV